MSVILVKSPRTQMNALAKFHTTFDFKLTHVVSQMSTHALMLCCIDI